MFRNMIFSSCIAGVFAALALTLAQHFWVTPLILQAETYETAAEINTPAEASEAHHHDEEAWAPEDGWERTMFTATTNSLLGIGFALLLTSFYGLRFYGSHRSRRTVEGIAWGVAGYIVFFAAPSLGLPPELPGTEAANLHDRQVWWLCTAFSTALALALLFLQTRWSLRLVALVLLALPHVLGAPHPLTEQSLAPATLQESFVQATHAVNGLFWVLLGLASIFLYQRFSAEKNV